MGKKRYDVEITLENKQNIAEASKKLRAFSRMAQSPKVESTSFTKKFRNLISGNKHKDSTKKSLPFDKTLGSDNSFMMSKDHAESDHNKSADKSVSKTILSDPHYNTMINKEQTSLLEKSMNFEINAEDMANEGTDEDELDKDIMTAVSEFDSNKSCGIFRPDSTAHMCWDLLGFVIIFYQAVVVPYRISFDTLATGNWYILEFSMDVYFWSDILMNLNSGIYIKGMLIMQRHKVIFNYLTGWFILDVLASFPYSLVLENILVGKSNSGMSSLSKTPQLLRLLKIIRFLRILRLLRVFKLKRLLYKVEEYIVTDTLTLIMDSLKILMVIFLMTHLMACTFYFVGDYESSDQPLTWINSNDIQDLEVFDKYITSVYFSFSTITTVGYGDITPVTNVEKIYGMGAMLIACGFFAYIVGSIGSIVNKSNIMVSDFRQKVSHINQFLIHKNIPISLKTTIMSYLEYM